MDSLKDNKPLRNLVIVAGLITVAGAAGIWFTGKQAKKAATDAQQQLSQATALADPPGKPSPTAENVELLEKQVESDRLAVAALRGQLAPYTFAADGSGYPETQTINGLESGPIGTSTFGPFLQGVFERRRDALVASGTELEDGFFLGFDNYRNTTPSTTEQARFLAYDLAAIDSLLDVLTKSGVKSIAVTRQASGPEVAASAETETPRGRQGAGGRDEEPLADYHRFQVQFTGQQKALQDALNYLASTKNFFFQTRVFSLENEKPIAPTRAEVDSQLEALKNANIPGNFGSGDAGGGSFGDAGSFGSSGGSFGSAGDFGSGGGFGETPDASATPPADGTAAAAPAEGAPTADGATDGAAATPTTEGFGSFGATTEETAPAAEAATVPSGAPIAVQVLGSETIAVTLDVALVTFRPLGPTAAAETEVTASEANAAEPAAEPAGDTEPGAAATPALEPAASN